MCQTNLVASESSEVGQEGYGMVVQCGMALSVCLGCCGLRGRMRRAGKSGFDSRHGYLDILAPYDSLVVF